jgi:ElaB/YqjD/DUF883 family membrane-anchored ribosome-binding protein
MSRRSGAQGPTTDAKGLDSQIGVEPKDTPDNTSTETPDSKTLRREIETPDSETLRREIEETREALGDTAAALAQKADLKGQVKGKVDTRKQQLHQLQENAKTKARSAVGQAKGRSSPIAGIIAVLLGAVGLALLVRSRNRSDRKKKR